ncbi:hypothetical protein [Isoptericola aurantiacus]|uniref:hypothetical protein n=1 Tax=Isoptericola aurantiacus TaxID=3377839 RepID=UPI00383B4162
MSRRLLLHLGINKTGSTALQIAFVRNRDVLREHGVHYPMSSSDARALSGEVVSGNGNALLPYLGQGGRANDEQALAALATLLRELDATEDPTVLYSSELLFRFSPDRITALAQLLEERGVTLQVAVYLRDIAGHALSVYAQGVKKNRVTSDLEGYLGRDGEPARYAPPLRSRLQHLRDVLGVENVRVLHYDTERAHLVPGFFSTVLRLDPAVPLDLGAGFVNRSLTVHELELMRHANRNLRQKSAAWALSDALMARPAPPDGRRLQLTQQDLDHLHHQFDDEVRWINETFFPDERLTVEGGAGVIADSRVEAESTAMERHLMDALVDLAGSKARTRPGTPTGGGALKPAVPPSDAATTPRNDQDRALWRRATGRLSRAVQVLVRGYY